MSWNQEEEIPMNAHFSESVGTPRSLVGLLDEAAEFFRRHGDEKFTTIRGLENLRLKAFNESRTKDSTIFTNIEEMLRGTGLKPDGTFGSLTALADLTQNHAHKIGCACNLGDNPTGNEVARRISMLIVELY